MSKSMNLTGYRRHSIKSFNTEGTEARKVKTTNSYTIKMMRAYGLRFGSSLFATRFVNVINTDAKVAFKWIGNLRRTSRVLTLFVAALLLNAVNCEGAEFDASKNIHTPILHLPFYKGERELLGYNPQYIPNTISFDEMNNPQKPKLIVKIDTGGKIINLTVDGNRAFILHKNEGVDIYDISEIKKIKKIGNLKIANLRDVAVSGKMLYCAQKDKGVRIFDISNFKNPKEIGAYGSKYEILGVTIVGNRLFLALEQKIKGGVQVLNVEDPKNIRSEGVWLTDADVYDVAVKGAKAYASMGPDGLSILDIQRPAVIKESAHIAIPGSTFSSLPVNPAIYIAGGINGIRVLKLK